MAYDGNPWLGLPDTLSDPGRLITISSDRLRRAGASTAEIASLLDLFDAAPRADQVRADVWLDQVSDANLRARIDAWRGADGEPLPDPPLTRDQQIVALREQLAELEEGGPYLPTATAIATYADRTDPVGVNFAGPLTVNGAPIAGAGAFANVFHYGDTNAARPQVQKVFWYGWVHPANMQVGDEYRAFDLNDPALLLSLAPWDSLYLADTVALANGATFTTWADLTENNRDLGPVSGFTTNPMTYVASAPAYNGQPAVAFNSSTVGTGVYAQDIVRPHTTIVLGNTTGLNQWLTSGVDATTFRQEVYHSTSENFRYTSGVVHLGPPADFNPHLHVMHASASGPYVRLDGGQVTAALGEHARRQFHLGGRLPSAGQSLVGHVVLAGTVAGTLTATQLARIESYCKSKWGVGA